MNFLQYHAGLNSTAEDTMILKNIAEMALGTLIGQMNIPILGTKGFDAVRAGNNANTYQVDVITGGAAGTRAPGAAVDASDTPTISSVTLQATEYTYPLYSDITFENSNAGNKIGQFIQEGVRKLISKMEAAAFQSLATFTGAESADFHTGTSSAQALAELSAAKLRMDKKFMPIDDRYLAVSFDGLSELLALPEFTRQDYAGFGQPYSTGRPAAKMQSFEGLPSGYLFTPTLTGTVALAEADDGSETELNIDGVTQAAVYPGTVITIGTEKMLVLSATAIATPGAAPNGACTITVRRGIWGTTPAAHADNDPITLTASVTNIGCSRSAVMYIMPEQMEQNDGSRTKVGASQDGYSLYILKEPAIGYNGGWNYVMSANFGLSVLRPIGGVQRIIKAA